MYPRLHASGLLSFSFSLSFFAFHFMWFIRGDSWRTLSSLQNITTLTWQVQFINCHTNHQINYNPPYETRGGRKKKINPQKINKYFDAKEGKSSSTSFRSRDLRVSHSEYGPCALYQLRHAASQIFVCLRYIILSLRSISTSVLMQFCGLLFPTVVQYSPRRE